MQCMHVRTMCHARHACARKVIRMTCVIKRMQWRACSQVTHAMACEWSKHAMHAWTCNLNCMASTMQCMYLHVQTYKACNAGVVCYMQGHASLYAWHAPCNTCNGMQVSMHGMHRATHEMACKFTCMACAMQCMLHAVEYPHQTTCIVTQFM